MSEDSGSRVALDFIDVLFAIVVGIGLERVIDKTWITRLDFSELHLWLFVLANLIVIGSWIGYHGAMKSGLKSGVETKQALARFLIDIVLLFQYARLLASFDDPQRLFSLIFQVFFWYVVWDLVVATERVPDMHSGVTLFWCFYMGLIWLVGQGDPRPLKETTLWWLLTSLTLFGVFAYRIKPNRTFLDSLFSKLALPHVWLNKCSM